MWNKKLIMFYVAYAVLSLLLIILIPLIPNMKDMYFIIPLIEFLLIFLVYNHFAIVKLKKTHKKEDMSMEKYRIRKTVLIFLMAITLVLLGIGIILYNVI